MKKTTLALAIAASLGSGAVSAAVITSPATFTMYDPTGAVVGGSAVVTGDTTVGMTSPTAFFGFKWTAHDLTPSASPSCTGANCYDAPFDWGATANIPVVLDWGIAGNVWTTLDGDADGIPGIAMTAGPFAGFSPYFQVTTVPIPAAAWLFGSGLLGLVGIARRRRKA